MIGQILSYVTVRNNQVARDGKTFDESSSSSLDDFLLEAYNKLVINYPKFYKMDRMSKLGLVASEILLSGNIKQYVSQETSVILSNSYSSLDTDIRFWDSVKTVPSPSLFVYTLPNIVAGEICIRNGFKGESNFFVSESFDCGWMAENVNQLLERNATSSCLAGWVNVMDNHADVFLYLAVHSNKGICAHTAENLRELYSNGGTKIKS